MGLDDIRPFNFRQRETVHAYANAATAKAIRRAFSYIWADTQVGGGKPQLELHEIEGPFAHEGVDVVPVPVYYPEVTEILGKRVFRKLTEIGRPIDMVNVFRRASDIPQHVDEILAANPKSVWVQLGIRNDAAAQRLRFRNVPSLSTSKHLAHISYSLTPVLSIILALAFTGAGLSKLTGQSQMRQAATHFGIAWERFRLIGGPELAGAGGVLIGFALTAIGALAAIGLTLLMLAALATHRRADDPVGQMIPPGALALISAVTAVLYIAH